MTTDLREVPLDFDPFLPAWIDDPYPYYARLRNEAPLFWSEKFRMRVLSRYGDVQAAARDWQTFTSTMGLDLDGTSAEGFHNVDFIGFDPPKHDVYRNLVKGPFAPKAVAALEPVIRERANSLIDRIDTRRPFDIGAAFSFQLPLYLIAHVLGLPEADLDFLGPKIVAFLDRSTNAGHVDTHSIEAAGELRSYLTELAREHRKAGLDDLLATISDADVEGRPFTDDELGSLCLFLFNAGVDTTNTLIMNILYWLEQFPAQKALLASDRSLIPAAVEEAARYDAPLQHILRVTTRPVEVGGEMLPAGTRTMLVFGAANRDERMFERPDAFDLHRAPGRHLAFGEGIHHCLGASLARLEARVSLELVLERLPTWRVTGPRERVIKENQRGFRVLTVEC